MTDIFSFIIEQKRELGVLLNLSNDALHIHVALILLFGSALLLRKRPDHFLPWLIVLLFELANEWNDITRLAVDEGTIDASLHDIYNTMFWPTLILLFGRFLFPRRAVGYSAATEAGDSTRPLPVSNEISQVGREI